jgi:hypothetical protein
LQTRALEIALQLRDGNPASWFHQRTAAVSFILTGQYAHSAGEPQVAQRSLEGCFAILDSLMEEGVEIDRPMQDLHAQIKGLLGR